MPYMSFAAGDEPPILVEVEAAEVVEAPGVVKAGVADRLHGAVTAARESLDDALAAVIRANTGAFLHAVESLPVQPTEVEIQFAVKATGELSNLAVGKLGGEANYSVKLSWKGRTGA